jgi:hypothetical protein
MFIRAAAIEAVLRTASTASPPVLELNAENRATRLYFRATANSRLNGNSVAPSARIG